MWFMSLGLSLMLLLCFRSLSRIMFCVAALSWSNVANLGPSPIYMLLVVWSLMDISFFLTKKQIIFQKYLELYNYLTR